MSDNCSNKEGVKRTKEGVTKKQKKEEKGSNINLSFEEKLNKEGRRGQEKGSIREGVKY